MNWVLLTAKSRGTSVQFKFFSFFMCKNFILNNKSTCSFLGGKKNFSRLGIVEFKCYTQNCAWLWQGKHLSFSKICKSWREKKGVYGSRIWMNHQWERLAIITWAERCWHWAGLGHSKQGTPGCCERSWGDWPGQQGRAQQHWHRCGGAGVQSPLPSWAPHLRAKM